MLFVYKIVSNISEYLVTLQGTLLFQRSKIFERPMAVQLSLKKGSTRLLRFTTASDCIDNTQIFDKEMLCL